MKMAKIYKVLLGTFVFLLLPLQAVSNNDLKAIRDLAKRILPISADQFIFRLEREDCDFFRLGNDGKRILIIGNNANSIAMGLNHYLKYYCKTTVSWYTDVPVSLPAQLPLPTSEKRFNAKVQHRFFLNYCTYGYTMPFWKWKQWERLIDWMALNGVNMPLAITGQEAVWQRVWKSFGMTDDQIRSYFTGPAYLPWHRMANIDRWLGPLPQQWLDSQLALQKQILARERELNMRPVLPAFAGHVPKELKSLYPNAHIEYLGKWAGFSDTYRCHFLHPDDKLFGEIQRRFLNEQQKLFGTDHIYGIDPFNEVDPPKWTPRYLSNVSKGIYKTLKDADSQAIWLQMTWMFYHDKKKWTCPRIKALLEAVPKGKMTLLDYHCENVEIWKQTKSFYGQPFIWCYLGNFGGNTTLTGNVKESGLRLDEALVHAGDNLQGIGSTLEGLDVQQFPYEYIFEKAWGINDNPSWIDYLADSHLGKTDSHVRQAWHLLVDSIFIQVPRTLGILPTYRPVMDGRNKRMDLAYDPKTLEKVWLEFLKVDTCKTVAFAIDLITVGRQVLGNDFAMIKAHFDQMYHQHNIVAMKRDAARMMDIINDLEVLTSYDPHCSLESWIKLARTYDEPQSLAAYYERNARTLITTWGGSLNDYAARAWSGLFKSYYAQRWQMYIDYTIKSIEENTIFNQADLDNRLKRFEQEWAETTSSIKWTKPSCDLMTFLLQIQDKRMKYHRLNSQQ